MCGGAHDHVMPVTADPRQYLGKPSAAPCRLPSRGLGKLGFVSDEDSYILKDDFPTRTALELAESADFLIYAKQEEQRQTSANRTGDK
jgi:hypothetical protein